MSEQTPSRTLATTMTSESGCHRPGPIERRRQRTQPPSTRDFAVEDDGDDGEDRAYESRDDESGNESHDESQAASVITAQDDDETCSGVSGRDEAEALLGMPLPTLKVMRLEAHRARDVVDGKKTLELTGRSCHVRGVVLVGETAEGAIAKSCALGAVTLGDCTRMSQQAFEATADRHHALGFAPAKAWLEKDTMYAQELHNAVRFEKPVPYERKAGARKWLRYEPPYSRSADAVIQPRSQPAPMAFDDLMAAVLGE